MRSFVFNTFLIIFSGVNASERPVLPVGRVKHWNRRNDFDPYFVSNLDNRLVTRQDDEEAFADEIEEPILDYITKLATIGDSYSAGIGAGDRLGSPLDALDPDSDFACSRYDQAYPYLVNNNVLLGNSSQREFQFLSCSGATGRDVIEKQIPDLESNQQVIMISAGGNDAELTNILNQCIFQWAALTELAAEAGQVKAKELPEFSFLLDQDWDAFSRGCEGQLDYSEDLIQADAFSDMLDEVINKAKEKLADGGKIYYTGYGKFFDTTFFSNLCNEVSWATWSYSIPGVMQEQQKLTLAHRVKMNDLVDQVNAKLKAAVRRAGDSVEFVDYDAYIGLWSGRFCQDGVDESVTDSNSRPELMFYKMNTWDPSGNSPWKRSRTGDLEGTFAGELDVFAEVTKLVDEDASFRVDQIETGNVTVQSLQNSTVNGSLPGAVFAPIELPNVLPDGYGRVFHPQVSLHRVISNMIIWHMTNNYRNEEGLRPYPKNLAIDRCPVRDRLEEPMDSFGDCSSEEEKFEKKTWEAVANRFCDDNGDADVNGKAQYGVDDVGQLDNWKTTLEWKAATDTDDCKHSCKSIFKTGFNNTKCSKDSDTMAQSGSLDVEGCGKATFEIERLPEGTEEKIFDRKCAAKDDFPNIPDVRGDRVDSVATYICDSLSKGKIKKDDSSTFPFYQTVQLHSNSAQYSMRAAWKDGCVLPNDKNEVEARNPLPRGYEGSDVSCHDLFYDNWRKCNNGGRGGSIQVGYIVYDFQPGWRIHSPCCM